MLYDMLSNRCTPEVINELKEDEVFVFGSKPIGHHKSGAEVRQVAEMFSYAIWFDNILLPKDFIHALIQNSDMSDVSLAINQITEGWYQCIRYALGYDWYAPSLNKKNIVSILTYDLCLYGPYFDEFDY